MSEVKKPHVFYQSGDETPWYCGRLGDSVEVLESIENYMMSEVADLQANPTEPRDIRLVVQHLTDEEVKALEGVD